MDEVSIPRPLHLGVRKVTGPVTIDADPEKLLWKPVPWSSDFMDILGARGPKPRHRTRVKIAWTDTDLLFLAELDEPHLWATLTEHDSVIFNDNDFEIFIDPDGDFQRYLELEINALNTTWDLLLARPYWAEGPAINGYEIKGMRSAVRLEGTLNDPSDNDQRWWVEVALPWAALAEVSNQKLPPVEGSSLRLNFSRVQWHLDVVDGQYAKRPKTPEDNWVWSPQHAVDMHRPWHWGIATFHGEAPDWAEIEAGQKLGELFLAQKKHHQDHGEYSAELAADMEIKVCRTWFVARYLRWEIDQNCEFRCAK
ncbi:MAG: carbohydrate-binding family 9-like protein [Armatimonadetes bacterium]|nr:carbohydrate-binding family 9-like protein [Armatimonadota bacterium]